jgi:hypothetical protein
MRALFVAVAAIFASGAALLACNGVLGIDKAVLEADGGGVDSGQMAGGDGGKGSADGGGTGPATDYHLRCDNYCNIMAAECTGSNGEYLTTGSVCQTICAQLPQAESDVLADGTIDPNFDPSTDAATAPTLNCRLWHANFAIVEQDPHTHCPHAGPLGGNVCGDACQEFCALDTALCAGDFAAYASMTDCLNACRPDAGYAGYAYNPADPEATSVNNTMSGNSLACRMYHLEAALDPAGEGKSYHCPHTGQVSATCVP